MNLHVLWLLPAAGGGILLGALVYALVNRVRSERARQSAEAVLDRAQREAELLRKEAELAARDTLVQAREIAEQEMKSRQQVLSVAADRLSKRDERMEREEQRLEERAQALDVRAASLEEKRLACTRRQSELETREDELRTRMSGLANLSPEQARTELLAGLEKELAEEQAASIRKAQKNIEAKVTIQARNLLTRAIQQVAADQVAAVSTVAVSLPNESMKGRIIGREGRNIRALEMATGVNVIIDDSPEVVVLSSFDPIRREIARVTLERLIADGRINPVRIEEMTDQVTAELDDLILQAGEEAVNEVHLAPVTRELARLLGRLKFRTSYSQNVLRHSVETAWLAGQMASELGLDPALARRAGLFHDIGKAVDHEVQGRHADIGADLLEKAGESRVLVEAVRGHHGEAGEPTPLAALISAADAVSASRPGARSDTSEEFLARMKSLEEIARDEPGVIRCLAMQAGRELRIFVEPTAVDDHLAVQLARTLARRVEEHLDYPGQIKVTVIRETRCVEYAR